MKQESEVHRWAMDAVGVRSTDVCLPSITTITTDRRCNSPPLTMAALGKRVSEQTVPPKLGERENAEVHWQTSVNREANQNEDTYAPVSPLFEVLFDLHDFPLPLSLSFFHLQVLINCYQAKYKGSLLEKKEWKIVQFANSQHCSFTSIPLPICWHSHGMLLLVANWILAVTGEKGCVAFAILTTSIVLAGKSKVCTSSFVFLFFRWQRIY